MHLRNRHFSLLERCSNPLLKSPLFARDVFEFVTETVLFLPEMCSSPLPKPSFFPRDVFESATETALFFPRRVRIRYWNRLIFFPKRVRIRYQHRHFPSLRCVRNPLPKPTRIFFETCSNPLPKPPHPLPSDVFESLTGTGRNKNSNRLPYDGIHKSGRRLRETPPTDKYPY